MKTQSLKKTVPFISHSTIRDGSTIILVDDFEISLEKQTTPRILRKLSNNIVLDRDQIVSAALAVTLLTEQIECCLEFIYSSKYWTELRKMESRASAGVFVSEFFHFVRASTFHMGAAQSDLLSASTILEHIATHTIEEDGHEHFYLNALKALGLSEATAYSIRPLPTSLELIYVVRTLAQMDPLSALACAAFMEGTSTNPKSVKMWHDMMSSSGRLPSESTRSIFQHLVEDDQFGHSESWKSTVLKERFIAPQPLCDALNSITILAEMIKRWFDSLLTGESRIGLEIGAKKSDRQTLAKLTTPLSFSLHEYFRPIVHPKVLDQVVYGRTKELADSSEISNYFFPDQAETMSVTSLSGSTQQPQKEKDTEHQPKALTKKLRNWSIAYREHRLWDEMLFPAHSLGLEIGLANELHFLCRSLNRSIGFAASATVRNDFRSGLLKNWNVLRQLESDLANYFEYRTGIKITHNRPLPSTIALCGAMADLSQIDGRSFSIALMHLDGLIKDICSSLDLPESSHPLSKTKFESLFVRIKQIANDGFCDACMLNVCEEISDDTVSNCESVVFFTWTFLDGVRSYYRVGPMASLSRVGWHIR